MSRLARVYPVIMAGKARYANRLLAVARANLLAYWPLNETSGTVAADLSGNGRNGAYTGVDLANTPGPATGYSHPYFDGANDYCNIYGASLAAAFNGQSGTAALWVKLYPGDWAVNAYRTALMISADGNNVLQLYKNNTGTRFDYFYRAGGTIDTLLYTTSSPAGWFHVAFTWSKAADNAKAYFSGVQVGSTLATLGTWAGAPAADLTNIGAEDNSPAVTTPFKGWLAHAAIWNTPLTAAQIALLATP